MPFIFRQLAEEISKAKNFKARELKTQSSAKPPTSFDRKTLLANNYLLGEAQVTNSSEARQRLRNARRVSEMKFKSRGEEVRVLRVQTEKEGNPEGRVLRRVSGSEPLFRFASDEMRAATPNTEPHIPALRLDLPDEEP